MGADGGPIARASTSPGGPRCLFYGDGKTFPSGGGSHQSRSWGNSVRGIPEKRGRGLPKRRTGIKIFPTAALQGKFHTGVNPQAIPGLRGDTGLLADQTQCIGKKTKGTREDRRGAGGFVGSRGQLGRQGGKVPLAEEEKGKKRGGFIQTGSGQAETGGVVMKLVRKRGEGQRFASRGEKSFFKREVGILGGKKTIFLPWVIRHTGGRGRTQKTRL